MSFPDTAILVKTSPGRTSLLWTLNSIKAHFPSHKYRIYIADEKPIDSWKEPLYEELLSQGHYIYTAEYKENVGVSRNHLLDALKNEKQVLRLDDDFELGGEFDFTALETVLWSAEDLAFCSDAERQIGDGKGVRSGFIRPMGGGIQKKGHVIIKKFHNMACHYKKSGNYRYRAANFTRNLILIKRHIIDNIRWNEELVFDGEHLDLMLSLQHRGFLGAYTPDSIHLHRDDLAKYRQNEQHARGTESREIMVKRFRERWDCSLSRTKYGVLWYLYEILRRLVR